MPGRHGDLVTKYRVIRGLVVPADRQPALSVERLGVDAAIIFADILLILEPLGIELEFAKGDGPVIHNPMREASDVDRLRELDDVLGSLSRRTHTLNSTFLNLSVEFVPWMLYRCLVSDLVRDRHL